jgi:hypothetical protein
MENQFRPMRLFGFLLAFGLMFAWIVWLINVVGVQGDSGFDDPSVWDQHRTAAWLTVAFVIVADIIATVLAFRKASNVKEQQETEAAERAKRLKAAGFDAGTLATSGLERVVAKSAAKSAAKEAAR